MKVFGSLEKAQIENLTADPTGTDLVAGRIWIRTDLNVARVYDGAIVRTFADLDSAQTFQNKILSGANVSDYIEFDEVTKPANPAAGKRRLYPKSDGTFYQLDSAGTEEPLGAGGSSGRNYIENGKAESNTIGWTRYANTSAANKPDNFGGTPNGSVTWTRFTLTPEYDTASFLFTKDASNRQGEGVYYDFNLEVGDLHSAMTALAKATTNSGYDDGDMRIYLVSSSDSFASDFNVLEFAPTEILAGKHGDINTQVQTDNSDTEYRLCFHVASTNATAYTVVLDDIEFKKNARNFGTVGTDWEAFTPVLKGSTTDPVYGTLDENEGYFRRVGDSAEIRINVRQSTAGTPGAGNYYFELPPGLSVDTSKINITAASGSNTIGAATARIASVNYDGGATIIYNQGISLYVGSSSANANYLDSTAPRSVVNAEWRVSFAATIPILGWGDTVQMSDRDDGRVVAGRVNATSLTPHATSGSWLQVTGWIAPSGSQEDTHASWDSTNDRWDIKYSGWYEASGGIGFASNASGLRYISIARNTTQIYGGSSVSSTHGTLEDLLSIQGEPFWCDAGDTVSMQSYQNSGGSLGYTPTGWANSFTIKKVQGPSAIAANELVKARMTKNSTQAMTGGTVTVINFDGTTYDSRGIATQGAASKITAPIAGLYTVKGKVAVFEAGETWSAGESLNIFIYKNGAVYSRRTVRNYAAHSDRYMYIDITDDVEMVAGDYVDIRINADTNNHTITADATGNVFSVCKAGF